MQNDCNAEYCPYGPLRGETTCGSSWDARLHQRADDSGVYLTYDDGPTPGVTDKLLDLLDQYEAKATFFVSGHSLLSKGSLSLLEEIASRGHTIGNHGMDHARNTCPRFCELQKLILKATGVESYLVRAPYGDRKLLLPYCELVRLTNAFEWTLSLEDWLPINGSVAVQRLCTGIVPGTIVLMHDGAPPAARFKDRSQVLFLSDVALARCGELGLRARGLRRLFPDSYFVA